MIVKIIVLLMLVYESRGDVVDGTTVYMRINSVAVKLDWSNAFPPSTQQGYSLYLAHNGNSGVHWTVHADQRTYLVTMLTDGSLYSGHVKPLNDDRPKRFQIITATMLQDSELPSFLNEYSETKSKENVTVSMVSVTITLKLFGLGRRRAVLEILRANRPLQYVDLPMDARSVTVSGLEPNVLLTFTLKHVVSTDPLKLKDLISAHVYTGNVFTVGDNAQKKHDANVSSTNMVKSFGYMKNRGELLRKTVKCYLENEETYKGFPCSDSDVCIPAHWVCDGVRDCKEGDDERGCKPSSNHTQTGTGTLYFTGCTRNEFRCFSRGEFVCLPNSWLCDGRKDCSSGWDEDEDNCGGAINRPGTIYYQQHNYSNGCRNDFYKCSNGFGCIPDKFVCDGDSDCRDGSDEWDCPPINYCDSRHEFQCFDSLTYEVSRQCIPRYWMCDDQDDCPNGEDEISDICKPEADNLQWKT